MMLEDPWVDEDPACRSLLSVMGAETTPDDGSRWTAAVLDLLAFDPTQPYLDRLRRSSRRGRTPAAPARRSPTDLWEAHQHDVDRAPRAPAGSADAARRLFQWVRERAAVVTGTADATMCRDEGWQFLCSAARSSAPT